MRLRRNRAGHTRKEWRNEAFGRNRKWDRRIPYLCSEFNGSIQNDLLLPTEFSESSAYFHRLAVSDRPSGSFVLCLRVDSSLMGQEFKLRHYRLRRRSL
jgi:hypothetical protein